MEEEAGSVQCEACGPADLTLHSDEAAAPRDKTRHPRPPSTAFSRPKGSARCDLPILISEAEDHNGNRVFCRRSRHFELLPPRVGSVLSLKLTPTEMWLLKSVAITSRELCIITVDLF